MRVLFVSRMPLDPNLGGPRVQIELGDEFRRRGHSVEHFSIEDAYPETASTRAGASWRSVTFSRCAGRYVRRHGDRFDVIEAHHMDLPFSKRLLRYSGLLVARSSGLAHLYYLEQRAAIRRWPAARGRLLGDFNRRAVSRIALLTAEASLRAADLINVANDSEAGFLANHRSC